MGLDLSAFDDVEIEASQEVKKKGVVDIIFLMDVSGSMGPAIGGLAKNIGTFVSTLEENNVKDYKAKIYTFSDLEHDAAELAMDFTRPYTNDPQELVNQLAQAIELVKQRGGLDEPESSLDAIFKITSDINSSFPDPFTDRTRIVILFTDASPKKIMEETIGADLEGLPLLSQNIKSNHINLFMYAPSNDDYNELSMSSGSNVTYNVINPQGENPVDALKNLDFTGTIETLGKTVSQLSIV